ncbi:MAG: Gfo/Idh/MocA family oxidoreductase [Lachnospiraceae bacterium]|nr:Gfo/Idh/MocA family oxidoreductase [Lachnospiraceae bacterium]
MDKMNLAILGAGRIATTMAGTVSAMDEVNLYAIAARDGERAKAFAEKYGAQKFYGSYEEMLQDPQVDLVYIATPHSLHCEHAKLCINHGKPVLCEKAFTWNAKEAREVLELAHEKGVFITEAMWTRYTPQSEKLRELLYGGSVSRWGTSVSEAAGIETKESGAQMGANGQMEPTAGECRSAAGIAVCPDADSAGGSNTGIPHKAAVGGLPAGMPQRVVAGESRPGGGRIGQIVGLTANLGYSLLDKERMVRPELAGGALLDLGVYTLNFATWVLGDDIQSISSSMVLHETGVDKSEFINLVYPNGTIAGLFNTMDAVSDRRGIIFGTEGRIEVENTNNYEEIRIYNNDYELVETIPQPPQITGYEYEVLACKRALEQGKLECEEMPHAHTLRVMELLDEIQTQWGK